MPCCCAVNCSNRSEQGFTLKIFPKDPYRRKLWAAKVRRKNWTPTPRTFICEIHFEEDQWENRNLRVLKKDAVPTIFYYPNPASEKTNVPDFKPSIKKIKIADTDMPKNVETKDTVSSLEEKLNSYNQVIQDLQEQNKIHVEEDQRVNKNLKTHIKGAMPTIINSSKPPLQKIKVERDAVPIIINCSKPASQSINLQVLEQPSKIIKVEDADMQKSNNSKNTVSLLKKKLHSANQVIRDLQEQNNVLKQLLKQYQLQVISLQSQS